MSAFDKLSEAHSDLYAAIGVISAYGRPRTPPPGYELDPFAKAVAKAIDDAGELCNRLSGLLCNARIDEHIEQVEVLRAASAVNRQQGEKLWSLWEKIHAKIEERKRAGPPAELELRILHDVLSMVQRELES